MLDESRVVRLILTLALGVTGCANAEPETGIVGAGEMGAGGALESAGAPNYDTGGDNGSQPDTTSNGGTATGGAGGAATSWGAAGTRPIGGAASTGGTASATSSGGSGTGGTTSGAGGAFDLCTLFPCAGGAAGAGGTAGAGGDVGTAGAGGAGSCDNLFCFDIFDCAIFHFDKLSCNFTKCDGFVCKP
jgi:hypothetical protein